MSLTYAKVGGPPADWRGLKVLNLNTGEEEDGVLEVNTVQGWVIRLRRGLDGKFLSDGEHLVTERVAGRFAIIQLPEVLK